MNNEKKISNDELTYKNRWLILAVLVTQPFMACLDGSIVNVALPTIANNLSESLNSIQWVVTSYLIVISSTILIFGSLGDIKCKSKVFLNGILIFILGSFLCGISISLLTLVASRVIQALGAAMVMSTNQGLITTIFPKSERGKALGISGSFVALGSLLGPALGGFIITYYSWHFIFLINIPIGLASYIFGRKYLPITNSKSLQKLDSVGAFMFMVSIICLITSITFSQNLGVGDPYIILSFSIGILLMLAFFMYEKKIKNPLLELTLFKTRSFSINLFCAFISFCSISAVNIIQPFYLQDVLNYTPSEISIIMMFYPAVLFFTAPISGTLSDRFGSKNLTLIGLSICMIVMFFLSTLDQNTSRSYLISLLSILGFANGLFQSPNNNIVMSSVPKTKLGIAGGINALIRNIGFAVGVSVSTWILYYRMSDLAGYRILSVIKGKEYIFIYGMKGVYIVTSIACLLALILSLIDKFKKN